MTVFLTVNTVGSEKRKAMVIGRANISDAFRHGCINKDNLLIIYRYNKKA